MVRRLQIEPEAYFIAAAGLLLLPLQCCLAMVAAAAVHECFHYFAAKMMDIQVYGLKISAKGCCLDMEPMTLDQELICAAAGPAGSLLLLGVVHQFPMVALCGTVQGLFNLLPLYPLDGGRILYCTAGLFFGEQGAMQVTKWSGRFVLFVLWCAGIYLALRVDWGILPAVLVVFLCFYMRKRKIPCKPARLGVQ